jgi:protein-L-isoaspartate(D-aspartate) O-methyltransferase
MSITGLEWQSRVRQLVHELTSAGVLTDPAWIEAFTTTPRHVFLPAFTDKSRVLTAADGEEWLAAVYSDRGLLTATANTPDDQPRPASSSSAPSVMAVMLDRLDLRPGHTVLEIGTGTGYNAALLAHRLGDDRVTSVDIDPKLVDTARRQLLALGMHPRLLTGDGAHGVAENAPYDRIIATCAITHIPSAWIRQLAPGGRLVAPLTGEEAAPLMVLDNTAPDELTGRFDPCPAAFMPLRHDAGNPLGPGQTTGFTGTGMPHYGSTHLDPRSIRDASADLALFCQLHIPGLRIASTGDEHTGSVIAHTADAMAETPLVPTTATTWPVLQRGHRRIWDTLETAVQTWHELGQPGRDRLGITAMAEPDTSTSGWTTPMARTAGPCKTPAAESARPTSWCSGLLLHGVPMARVQGRQIHCGPWRRAVVVLPADLRQVPSVRPLQLVAFVVAEPPAPHRSSKSTIFGTGNSLGRGQQRPRCAVNSAANDSTALRTRLAAPVGRKQRWPSVTLAQAASTASTSLALPPPHSIRSRHSAINQLPSPHAAHCPHDSMARNLAKASVTATMQAESS